MSDESVRTALRSNEKLAVIEAPAGCGKTHQGADYAREAAATANGRVLILTHTHAACSVFAKRNRGTSSRVEIRTIDSLISQIAGAYHAGLGLPADVSAWARQNSDGYAQLAMMVAAFLDRHPMVADALARRYPVVICDEHQDCSGDQHAMVIALHSHGARLRVFADPMQRIFPSKTMPGGKPPLDWNSLVKEAGAYEELDWPHRWNEGCAKLGAWTLRAREALKAGGQLNLTTDLPRSVEVVMAEDQSQRWDDYQLSRDDRRPIVAFEKARGSLLIVSHFGETAQNLRAFFGRRIPLWEGHTRPTLERLVGLMAAHKGDAKQLGQAVVNFMGVVGKGFSPSAFGDRLVSEAAEGCVRKASGKPAAIQAIARHLVASPDHRGVANALREIAELRRGNNAFREIEIDCQTEFWEAVRLGAHSDLEEGFAQITHHRTYARPTPPAKAISTIHKAKGLECDGVIVMPCDAQTFPDNQEARCLLYVALSRAKRRLMLVVSRQNPSPLIVL